MEKQLAIALVLMAAFGACFCGDEEEKKMAEECVDELKVPIEELKKIEETQQPTTKEGQQYLGCLVVKMGMASKDGQPDKEKCFKLIDSDCGRGTPEDCENATKMCEECTAKTYSDEDYLGAYEYLNCLRTPPAK